MPIFNYHCPACGADFELLVRNDREKVECPECCNSNIEKRPSTFSSRVSRGGCGGAGHCEVASGGHCCGAHCGCRK